MRAPARPHLSGRIVSGLISVGGQKRVGKRGPTRHLKNFLYVPSENLSIVAGKLHTKCKITLIEYLKIPETVVVNKSSSSNSSSNRAMGCDAIVGSLPL